MPERGAASSGPNRRQLLGLLGAGSLTALSAAVVATSGALDDEEDEEQQDGLEDEEDDPDEEESSDLLSVDWESIYGDDRTGSFASANDRDGEVELAGVQLDDDDAGVGWLVDGAAPDTETTEQTYVSELNRSRQELSEGYAIHDAVECTIPVEGGRLLVGWTHDISPDTRTAWVRRLDEAGTEQWVTEFDRPDVNSFRDVILDGVATDDGGAVLAGVTLGSEFVDTRRGDGWLVRIDAAGEREWERTYNTEGTTHSDWTDDERHDRFTTIRATDDGYLLAGTTTPEDVSETTPSEPWLLAVDNEGDEQWEWVGQREETEGLSDRVLTDIATADGGFLTVGTAGSYEYVRPLRSNQLTGDGMIARVEDESVVWEQEVEDTSIRAVQRLDDEYYLLGGQQDEVAWIGVVDGDGQLRDERRLHEVAGTIRSADRSADGNVIVAGHRDDADRPVGFAASVSVTVPDP